MGMFGPTNDELENLKVEITSTISQSIEDLKQQIGAKITQVEASMAIRATDSEAAAQLAAENAAAHASEANEAGKNVRAILQELEGFKTSATAELTSLSAEIADASTTNTQLKEGIETTNTFYEKFIEEKEAVDAQISDLREKIESANEYLAIALQLPGAVELAQSSLDEAKTVGESIKNTLAHAVSRKSEIDELHKLILGEDVEDADGDNQHIDGLRDELNATYKDLLETATGLEKTTAKVISQVTEKHNMLLTNRQNDYEQLLTVASARYDQINAQLTGLLPGAMAEGLSAAYDKKKESEEISLLKFEKRFSSAIYGLVAISLIPFSVDVYLLAVANLELVQVIKDTPNLIFSILPIYFPVLWLAYSTGKKANLSKRLIEEYTHKSVLGKTFSGLSNQIETLPNHGAVREELRTKLLFNVLQVSAENPGKLITDYNKSDHPLMDALEKSGKLSESLETLSKIPGLSALAKKMTEKADIALAVQTKKVGAGLAASEKLSSSASDKDGEVSAT